jgi:hypothetical protein
LTTRLGTVPDVLGLLFELSERELTTPTPLRARGGLERHPAELSTQVDLRPHVCVCTRDLVLVGIVLRYRHTCGEPDGEPYRQADLACEHPESTGELLAEARAAVEEPDEGVLAGGSCRRRQRVDEASVVEEVDQ